MRLLGVLIAAIALAGQIALGALVPQGTTPETQLAELATTSFICHSEDKPDSRDGKPHHHAPDCALCPLCQAIAQSGALIHPSAISLLVPLIAPVSNAVPPPSRATPLFGLATVYPRGPPPLI